MIRIGICDDSPAFLQQTKFMLDHWDGGPAHIQTELFEDGDSLLRVHEQEPFDIVLLDVVMPLLNGIETARELREKDTAVKIVFLTSSPEFAVDSYTVKASNYILKPVHPEQFFTCLSELVEQLSEKEPALVLRSARGVHHVAMSQIEYLEAHNKHVEFYLTDGTVIDSLDPLYSHEETLQSHRDFYKVHRSYIVNVDHISTYTSKEVVMRSGSRVPIARSIQREFEAAYFAIVFGKAGDL